MYFKLYFIKGMIKKKKVFSINNDCLVMNPKF